MSTVKCPSCQNHVQPRLWNYSPWYGFFTYMKTQHLCNLCGAVMYETGGGIRIGMLIFCAICIAPFAYVILSLGGRGTSFSGFFPIALALLQLYLLYRLFCWISKKLKRSDSAPPYLVAGPEQSQQSSGNPVSRIDAIEKLVAFKERGLLTQEEFEQEKKKILEQ